MESNVLPAVDQEDSVASEGEGIQRNLPALLSGALTASQEHQVNAYFLQNRNEVFASADGILTMCQKFCLDIVTCHRTACAIFDDFPEACCISSAGGVDGGSMDGGNNVTEMIAVAQLMQYLRCVVAPVACSAEPSGSVDGSLTWAEGFLLVRFLAYLQRESQGKAQTDDGGKLLRGLFDSCLEDAEGSSFPVVRWSVICKRLEEFCESSTNHEVGSALRQLLLKSMGSVDDVVVTQQFRERQLSLLVEESSLASGVQSKEGSPARGTGEGDDPQLTFDDFCQHLAMQVNYQIGDKLEASTTRGQSFAGAFGANNATGRRRGRTATAIGFRSKPNALSAFSANDVFGDRDDEGSVTFSQSISDLEDSNRYSPPSASRRRKSSTDVMIPLAEGSEVTPRGGMRKSIADSLRKLCHHHPKPQARVVKGAVHPVIDKLNHTAEKIEVMKSSTNEKMDDMWGRVKQGIGILLPGGIPKQASVSAFKKPSRFTSNAYAPSMVSREEERLKALIGEIDTNKQIALIEQRRLTEKQREADRIRDFKQRRLIEQKQQREHEWSESNSIVSMEDAFVRSLAQAVHTIEGTIQSKHFPPSAIRRVSNAESRKVGKALRDLAQLRVREDDIDWLGGVAHRPLPTPTPDPFQTHRQRPTSALKARPANLQDTSSRREASSPSRFRKFEENGMYELEVIRDQGGVLRTNLANVFSIPDLLECLEEVLSPLPVGKRMVSDVFVEVVAPPSGSRYGGQYLPLVSIDDLPRIARVKAFFS